LNVKLGHLVIALVVLSLIVVGFKDRINDIQSPTDEFVEQTQLHQVNQFFSGGIAINNNKLYNTALFGGGISLNQGMDTETTVTSECYKGSLSQVGYTGLYQACDHQCYYNNQWWCFPSGVNCDTVMYCDGVPQGCESNYKSCCLYDDKVHVCAPIYPVDVPCDTHFFCNGKDLFCDEGNTGICCDGTPGCCLPTQIPFCYEDNVRCCLIGSKIGLDGWCWPEDYECKLDEHCSLGEICVLHKCVSNDIHWSVVVEDANTQAPISDAEVKIYRSSKKYIETTDIDGIAQFVVPRSTYSIKVNKEGYLQDFFTLIKIHNPGWIKSKLKSLDCITGDVQYNTCPDGFQVEQCICQDGYWACIESPESLCIGHGYCNIVDDCPIKDGYAGKCFENLCEYEKKGNLMFIGAIIGSLAVIGGYFAFKKK